MADRTLAQALRAHLTCNHGLSLSANGTEIALTHNGGTHQFTLPDGTPTEQGSLLFHECANRMARDGEHTKVPLAISDAEYAGFLNV